MEQRPLFTVIEQASMVVRDARESARFLSDHYGIGPWVSVQFGDNFDGNQNWIPVEHVVLEGKPIGDYSIDCCCCKLDNGVELELISPKRGDSVFARFLEQYGSGIQHLSINNVDYEESIYRMRAAGFRDGQTATIDRHETCTFIDHRDVFGCYLELHKRPDTFTYPQVELHYIPDPEAEDLPKEKPLFTRLEQVGILVMDLDRAVSIIEERYGIGSWRKLSCGADPNSDVQLTAAMLDGAAIEVPTARVAVCDALNVQLKLIEPASGSDVYANCLAQYGPMAHHLVFRPTAGYEDACARLRAADPAHTQTVAWDDGESFCADHMAELGTYLEVYRRRSTLN